MSTWDLMQFTHIPDGFACIVALHSAHSLHKQQQSALLTDGRREPILVGYAHVAGGESLVLH